MQKIDLLCIGKLKESYLRQACQEYEKRLSAYCKLSIIELPECRLPQDPSPAQIAQGLAQEGQSILQKLSPQATLISLCIEGEELSSPQLAQRMAAFAAKGSGHLAFAIGGSWGLDPAVKARSALRLSMSPMTFPHQLARVMVLEQLYRACSINHNGKYHK